MHFTEKKTQLLSQLHYLSVTHNRDYRTTIIPAVESIPEDEEALLDIYIAILEKDSHDLMHSREALQAVSKLHNILNISP